LTKTKIKYRIKKNKNIKREYDNTFEKKVVALAMKILLRDSDIHINKKLIDFFLKYIYNLIKGLLRKLID